MLVPAGAIDSLVQRLYSQSGQEPRAAFARDLVDIVVESARFDNREPVLSPEALDRALRLFLAKHGPVWAEGDVSQA